MTSLDAPAVTRPRRAGTVYLAAMATLTLAWLTATLAWHDSWSESTRANGLLLPPLLLLVIAMGYNMRIHLRRRPVRFDVDGGAFVAPPVDGLAASASAMMLAGSAVLAGLTLFPLSADVPRGLVLFGRISAALVAAMFLVRLTVRRRAAGQIQLRPEGLRFTYSYGSRDVPWEAIAAGPKRSVGFAEPFLRIGKPELLHATGLFRRHPTKAHLPTSESGILREFLADAINYYLATPGARHTIGTDEGYAHLRRRLQADWA